MRADKYLSNSGIGSRKEIKALIKDGLVSVNEKIIGDAAYKIEDNDIVTVNGIRVNYKKYVYLMLNKPAGYVSAVFDKKLPVVTEFVPEAFLHFDVFPVGRLDIDTEGLLILTNDGELTHRLLSPKKHVDKKYFVRCEKSIDKNCERDFTKGIVLDDGYKTMSADIEFCENESECILTIREGKFHQVKRMFEAIGNKVVYLKRIQMGFLSLDDTLEKGEIRELSEQEVKLLEKRGD